MVSAMLRRPLPWPTNRAFELLCKGQRAAIGGRQPRFSNDSDHQACFASARVERIELVRPFTMLGNGVPQSDAGVHQARQRRQNVDRREDTAPLQFAVEHDLAFGDVPGEVGNGMRDVGVGHGENRQLRDAARRPFDDPRTLEKRREVGVHVAGIAATSGHFVARCRNFAQRLAVVRDVGHHDEHVQPVHVGQVLGAGQRGAWRQQSLDGRILRLVQIEHAALERSAVLKRSRNVRVSRAVMPMAAKTTANGSSRGARACSTIVAARSSAGRPGPENTGSFWPRTSVFKPSIAEMPVSMKSRGGTRRVGLIGAPHSGRRASPMGRGRPSFGSPTPLERATEQIPADDHACEIPGQRDAGRGRGEPQRLLQHLHHGDVAARIDHLTA